MKEYVFYTCEGYTESPTGKSVENIQILGFANGKKKKEAKDNLLRENKWILESGFHERAIESRQLVDEKLKNLIKQVIAYSWKDEKRHYEEDPQKNHIFLILKELKNLIDKL